MRLLPLLCLAATLGCTTSAPDDDGAFDFDPNPSGTSGTTSDTTTGASSGATSSDAASDSDATSETGGTNTTGAATTGGSGTTTGVTSTTGVGTDGTGGTGTASGGSSGGVTTGGNGEQPGEGPWSHCTMGVDCGEGMGCLNNGPTPTDGFCTEVCVGFADPSGCAPSPGGTALVSCVELGGQNICALDCSAGKTCPQGMICTQETADNGTIEICM